jgi:signal transduction histidine kinase
LAALGVWLVVPEIRWATAAAALAALTVVLAARSGKTTKVAVSVLGLAGSGAALHTSFLVGRIENQWFQVRESLVLRADRQLAATLSDAVATVEALAARGVNLVTQSREEAFALLEGGLAGRSPERGVVLFDESSRPWAWAGSHRLPSVPGPSGWQARITPFYVVLEVQRQTNGRTAVAQVLLAADSAIPNRDATVTARFARATGTELQFYRHDRVPPHVTVYDYCLPACEAEDVVPDTLFSVRAVPPTQGTLKLDVLDRGGRRVAFATAATLAVLVVIAGPLLRWLAVAGFGVLFVFTPLGPSLGMGGFFSSGTYFWPALGPFATSTGTLFVVAALVLMGAAALWPAGGRRLPWILGPASVLILSSPFVLQQLAGAVTPPATGIGLGMWVSWSVTVGVASAALFIVAALLARLAGRVAAPGWTTWAASGGALFVAVLGLLVWRPSGGWPEWYTVLWIPVVLFAVLHSIGFRMVVAVAVVSGAAAVLLTWGAVLEGRLVWAERDTRRFLADPDPITMGLLGRFGADLQSQPVPRSEAELYKRWKRSSMSQEERPAVLVSWGRSRQETARLELAELNLPSRILPMRARAAANRREPVVSTELSRIPGVHYVLAVPYPDGSAVTVAVGPQSRVIPPVRVAQFLRGERPVAPPYEMYLSAPLPPGDETVSLSWTRDGSTVRGEQSLDVPGGLLHLHIDVPLGNVGTLVVRGALLIVLNVAMVSLFWIVGEALRGRLLSVAPVVGLLAPRQSFRGRLTLVLGLFFLAPTLGFTAWSAGRLSTEGASTRDVVIRQTLRGAAVAALDFALGGGQAARERLQDLADRLDADLILYEDGALLHSSAQVLVELGLLAPYMPPALYRALVLEDGLEATTDRSIGGRATRVGYRKLGSVGVRSPVLAAPRLVDDRRLSENQTDLFFGLLLATILGFAVAAWLAARAARTMAEPVQALSGAAGAVGRGDAVSPFDPNMPAEFVPVVNAFEQMARDVKTHQEALERALTFTGAILRNVGTGVVTLNPELHVTTANPRAIVLLGINPSPMEPVDRQTPGDWAPFWEWVEGFLRGEQETDAREFTVGEKRIRAQVAALPPAEGGCVVALDDATELAVAERVLAWGEMARQVAHEIKNPLTPIRLGIQHLQRARKDRRKGFDQALEKTAQQILAEIERLDSIARAFSRFGAPPAEAGPLTPVDMAEAARETASLYALGGGTSVVVQADEEGCVGTVRKDEFKEVLVNLIENARGAGATEVIIGIANPEDSRVRVTLSDNGEGIPVEYLSRIFEPRFSTTTSGTGLGLAICKRLVEAWGGSIKAESQVGKGTVVTFEV